MQKRLLIIVGITILFLGMSINPTPAIDNAGNVEYPKESFSIDCGQDPPMITFLYEYLGHIWLLGLWFYAIIVEAWDKVSGMDRLEIYFNDELKEIIYCIYGNYCVFRWEFELPPAPDIIIKAVAYDRAGNSATDSFDLSEFKINRHSKDNFFNNHLMIENELREKSEIGGTDDYKEIITFIEGIAEINWLKRKGIFRGEVEIKHTWPTGVNLRGLRYSNSGVEKYNISEVGYVYASRFIGFSKMNLIWQFVTIGFAYGNIEWELIEY